MPSIRNRKINFLRVEGQVMVDVCRAMKGSFADQSFANELKLERNVVAKNAKNIFLFTFLHGRDWFHSS